MLKGGVAAGMDGGDRGLGINDLLKGHFPMSPCMTLPITPCLSEDRHRPNFSDISQRCQGQHV